MLEVGVRPRTVNEGHLRVLSEVSQLVLRQVVPVDDQHLGRLAELLQNLDEARSREVRGRIPLVDALSISTMVRYGSQKLELFACLGHVHGHRAQFIDGSPTACRAGIEVVTV